MSSNTPKDLANVPTRDVIEAVNAASRFYATCRHLPPCQVNTADHSPLHLAPQPIHHPPPFLADHTRALSAHAMNHRGIIRLLNDALRAALLRHRIDRLLVLAEEFDQTTTIADLSFFAKNDDDEEETPLHRINPLAPDTRSHPTCPGLVHKRAEDLCIWSDKVHLYSAAMTLGRALAVRAFRCAPTAPDDLERHAELQWHTDPARAHVRFHLDVYTLKTLRTNLLHRNDDNPSLEPPPPTRL